MLRKDVVASLLKSSCENFNPVKRYGKTNLTGFVFRLWENTGGLVAIVLTEYLSLSVDTIAFKPYLSTLQI